MATFAVVLAAIILSLNRIANAFELEVVEVGVATPFPGCHVSYTAAIVRAHNFSRASLRPLSVAATVPIAAHEWYGKNSFWSVTFFCGLH
jgi:hypothetical protein